MNQWKIRFYICGERQLTHPNPKKKGAQPRIYFFLGPVGSVWLKIRRVPGSVGLLPWIVLFTLYSNIQKKLYSLAKGRPSLELYLRLPLTCLRKVTSQKAPQAESLRKHCNFISRQSLSKIAARQGSTSIYSFLQQFSDCNTSTGEINKR